MSKILVVEDHPGMRQSLCQMLKENGYPVDEVADGEQAIERVRTTIFDLVILDLRLPKRDGISVLEALKKVNAETAVIMITAYGMVETAVQAMKLGASDFIQKPFTIDEMEFKVKRVLEAQRLNWENQRLTWENEALRREVGAQADWDIVGVSEKMRQVLNTVQRVAPTKSTVLIRGESGTGKELIARAIHEHSHRRDKPYVRVSCAALGEGVLESELFGHEKGAFTNAVVQRIGRFELADGGTLFLDEIGDVPLSTQTKLLRVLQEQEFERVGSSRSIQVDVRVIAATHRALEAAIKAGTFREDLFYRLNVIPLYIPPLRERKEDIPPLVEAFLKKYSRETNKQVTKVQPEGMNLLINYSWPGNVRELENVIERCVVLAVTDSIIVEQLPPEIRAATGDAPLKVPEDLPLPQILDNLEKQLIIHALWKANGVKAEAAQLLGIQRTALHYKLQKYGLL